MSNTSKLTNKQINSINRLEDKIQRMSSWRFATMMQPVQARVLVGAGKVVANFPHWSSSVGGPLLLRMGSWNQSRYGKENPNEGWPGRSHTLALTHVRIEHPTNSYSFFFFFAKFYDSIPCVNNIHYIQRTFITFLVSTRATFLSCFVLLITNSCVHGLQLGDHNLKMPKRSQTGKRKIL